MIHTDYHEVYDTRFFERADGIIHWENGKMRYGDAVCVVAYAMGFSSFESVQNLFNFSDGRDHNTDKLTAIEQIEKLKTQQVRYPKNVLDIGGGRGEVSYAFSYLGAEVQCIEPHKDADFWQWGTREKLFNKKGSIRLINRTCPECLPLIDFDEIDTVVMVESLEHIPKECFDPVWKKCKEALIQNHGMLVVANWILYHPLPAVNREHCRLVDDALYKELALDGKVILQNGSHMVVQF